MLNRVLIFLDRREHDATLRRKAIEHQAEELCELTGGLIDCFVDADGIAKFFLTGTDFPPLSIDGARQALAQTLSDIASDCTRAAEALKGGAA